MAVTGLEITRRVPLAGGKSFGEAGPYEFLTGTVHLAVAPKDPHNTAIVDLGLAPRDRSGRVQFSADFGLLLPAEPPRGNGRLLFDVLNRGQARVIAIFNDGEGGPGVGEIDPGNGFLQRRGYTAAWCGWQQDVPQDATGRFGLRGPEPLLNGQSIEGKVLCEFQPAAPARSLLLSDLAHQPYPAADLDDPSATLTVRGYTTAERTSIPRERWRFAREDGGRPVPDSRYVYLDGGFEPGLLYELVYTARGARVVGLGLLAARDVVSWLKYGDAASGNPAAGALRYALGFGRSQSGRFLRQFLYHGLNQDEAGRQVFDGVMPLVAGARRGEFNVRFGQPSKTLGQGVGALFPFSDGLQQDATLGAEDGLLARVAELGCVPKTINLNSSSEYWGGDRGSGGQSSLVTTDPAGTRDVEPPETSRVYLMAGTQHVPADVPPPAVTATGLRMQHALSCVYYNPYLRAALVNLDRWVSGGEAPPPSLHPRLADGSAVTPEQAGEYFKQVPGAPPPLHSSTLYRMDFGPRLASEGIADQLPPRLGEPYRYYVSAVDADGNEVAGIRGPEVQVPLASYTGWNTRHPDVGAPGELVSMTGSTLPFPKTAAEAEALGDPRRPVAERYPSKEEYLRQGRVAAEQLVKDRYMLEEDVERVLARMSMLWDAFSAEQA